MSDSHIQTSTITNVVCNRTRNALTIVLVVCAAVLLTGFNRCPPLSDAKGKVSDFKIEWDVNSNLDAGLSVTFTVTNVGKAGVIEIEPRCSTSEGEWKRTQVLDFAPGESKNLSYFFHEPTVDSSNNYCGVGITPRAP